LWGENQLPLELQPGTVPVSFNPAFDIPDQNEVDDLISRAELNHPEIQKLGFKLQELEVLNRLYREFLKPEVNLEYGFLNEPIVPHNENNGLSFDDNLKFQLDFSFPLLLRKERAKLEQNKIKSEQTLYSRQYISREITNDIYSLYAELVNGTIILQQQNEIMQSYERLVEAEFINLENGESDLFRINIQQNKYLESYLKYLKTRYKLEQLKATLYWAAGVQNLNLVP
jgi:outer membrane protein TolC